MSLLSDNYDNGGHSAREPSREIRGHCNVCSYGRPKWKGIPVTHGKRIGMRSLLIGGCKPLIFPNSIWSSFGRNTAPRGVKVQLFFFACIWARCLEGFVRRPTAPG